MSTYTICRGCHYSSFIPSPHTGVKTVSGKITFHSDCAYTLTDVACVNDVNKAYGFGYGLDHKKWSIRLGWRVHDNGKLELFNFSHVNSKITQKRLGTAKVFFDYDTPYSFSITNNTDIKKSIVTVGNYSATVDFDYAPTAGFYLKPYFGGDCPAPHSMTIDINV